MIVAAQDLRERDLLLGALPISVLEEVDHIELRVRRELREVDHDVVSLSDRLARKDALAVLEACDRRPPVERDGVLHDVAIIGHHVKRHAVVGYV